MYRRGRMGYFNLPLGRDGRRYGPPFSFFGQRLAIPDAGFAPSGRGTAEAFRCTDVQTRDMGGALREA